MQATVVFESPRRMAMALNDRDPRRLFKGGVPTRAPG
jgi:hypothetical protein